MKPEITKSNNSRTKPIANYVWLLFAVLAIFVYFFGLTIAFLGPDEARYAQVAREMSERGDWITPTLGGFNWFEKPALLYWLEMVSYKLFGINEFAARFGPTLFGLGTIVSLWLLGRSLPKTKGQRPETEFANYLALLAASTLGIIVFARGASFDIIITFPVTAALVCFFRWYLQNEAGDQIDGSSNPRVSTSLLFFYVFIGIALLAKGLIGIVFPFAIVGLFYLSSRRFPSRIFLVSVIWGTLIATLIAAVWYIPMYQRHGYEFINEFFVQHHFERFTTNKYRHPQPLYFFLWVLPLMTLPWLPFFFAAIWKFFGKGFFHRGDAETHREQIGSSLNSGVSASPLLAFATAWLLVPLVFFSFSGSKLPGYMLPAIPAAIVLTSVFVFELVQKSIKWRNSVLAIAFSTFAATMLLLRFAVPQFAETDSVKELIAIADERGYTTNRILTLHTISHNAEFYAASRLLRDEAGKQQRLESVDQILRQINIDNGRSVLVLVPLEYLSQLTANEKIKTEVLKDNGELVIVVVSRRNN